MRRKGNKKRCVRGKSCGSTCIASQRSCRVAFLSSGQLSKTAELLARMSKAYDRNRRTFENSSTKVGYDKWKPLAEGNYGKVSISPDGKRVVKELLVGKDGKKGEFGEFELELATRMGQLGHSPKIYSSSSEHIEMSTAKGKPLWAGYARGENEPVMNATQAKKASAALRDLHKLGYAHGDLHALQFVVNGNNVQLVDYGLSVPTSRQPARVMQDLSKIGGLVNWKNPELANDPYVGLVNRYLDRYKEIQGTSQAAKNKRARLGEDYLQELGRMQ